MSEITDPLVTFRIKLPLRYWLRVQVWATREDMHANTPEEPRKDFEAIFLPTDGLCIGTIHMAAHDVTAGTRAHEIRHAVDEFAARAYRERLGSVTEHITNEIDRTLAQVPE